MQTKNQMSQLEDEIRKFDEEMTRYEYAFVAERNRQREEFKIEHEKKLVEFEKYMSTKIRTPRMPWEGRLRARK